MASTGQHVHIPLHSAQHDTLPTANSMLQICLSLRPMLRPGKLGIVNDIMTAGILAALCQ